MDSIYARLGQDNAVSLWQGIHCAKLCIDNNKAWQMRKIFYDGALDELLIPYVRHKLKSGSTKCANHVRERQCLAPDRGPDQLFSGKENQTVSEINNFFTRSLVKILNGGKLGIYLLKRLA